jgi:hypothetical protein
MRYFTIPTFVLATVQTLSAQTFQSYGKIQVAVIDVIRAKERIPPGMPPQFGIAAGPGHELVIIKARIRVPSGQPHVEFARSECQLLLASPSPSDSVALQARRIVFSSPENATVTWEETIEFPFEIRESLPVATFHLGALSFDLQQFPAARTKEP